MNLVRDEYIHRATLRPLFWQNTIWLSLENVYTRLRIVSPRKAGVENDIPILKRLLGVLCEYGTADDPNEGKDFAGGRGIPNEGRGFRMLVEGSPGIGKTTFCLKLTYDWAKQSSGAPFNFPEFELVLLLRCRDINGKLMDALPEQLFPKDVKKKTEMELRNFINNNQKRILIVLDGLDELPKTSKCHVDDFLEGNILRDCNALVTTRQEKGIEAREKFVFDACLEITGFSEDCAIEYIRKHFKNLVPERSFRGEKLVEEIKQNDDLHAFRNNPLSLLLLCVVYEDHDGMLPSSRTNLYQIIVRCLLRRYCAKHDEKDCKDDRDLEKRFERYILPLGERAWNCLLHDRHSFREDELKGLESDDKLVVCGLGLVYKEESLKRLNPQHEYCFLHKSFQEYLAALYIVHKLQHNQFNLFEHLDFHEVTNMVNQVLYFVCGIGGKEACSLIAQIGQKLKSNWDWLACEEVQSYFFCDILNESAKAEEVARTLCSFIPFPRVVKLSLEVEVRGGTWFQKRHWPQFRVLKACLSVAKLDTPEEVHINITGDGWGRDRTRKVASLPRLKTLDISINAKRFSVEEFELFQGLSDGASISELRLPAPNNLEVSKSAFVEGMKTLKEVTFRLLGPVDKSWARALDEGLPSFTLLSSVSFMIYGPMGETALYFLEKLLSHRPMITFTLVTCGDMQDSLAETLARGLTGAVAVKRLNLHVLGKLSIDAATLIERAIVGNHSLNNLKVSFLGELPDCWQGIAENIQTELAKRPQVSFTIYPNPLSQVTANQIRHLRPVDYGFPARQRFTLNVWGELCAEGAEALYEVVPCTPQSQLTLNIHGKLTNEFLLCTARFVHRHVMLSPITINTWDRLTKEGKTLFEELKLDKSSGVTVKWCDFHQDKSTDDQNVSIDNDASLTALFTIAQNTNQEKVNVTINLREDETENFGDILCDCLENITSLSTLVLTVNNYSYNYRNCFDGLGKGLKGNTSLNTLTLTVANYGAMNDCWVGDLSNGLASNTSLNAFTLAVINYHYLEWRSGLNKLLASKSSLNTFNLTVANYGDLYDRDDALGNGLASHTSVTAFTLSVVSYNVVDCKWGLRLGKLLASKSSLNTFSLTVANCGEMAEWMIGLGNGLASNTSLNSFTLAVTDYGNTNGDWIGSLVNGLAKNTKLNDFSFTINNYSSMNGDWGRTLGRGLSQCESLITCNLTFNICNEVVVNFLPGLIEGLVKSKSLRTLRLEVNYQHLKCGSCEYDFSKLVDTLSLIEITVSFYGSGGQQARSWNAVAADEFLVNIPI